MSLHKIARIAALFFFLILSVNMSGCGQAMEELGITDRTMKSSDLSREEKDLIDKELVGNQQADSYDLKWWQEEIVKECRFGTGYLLRKYPSHTFSIRERLMRGIGEPDKFAYYYVFYADGNETESYHLGITKNDDGAFSGSDNFYGKAISEKYADAIKEEIGTACLYECAVSTSIKDMNGVDCTEYLNIRNVKTPEINPSTVIYMNGNSIDQLFSGVEQEIKASLDTKKMVGSFRLCIYSGVPENCSSVSDYEACLKDGKLTQVFTDDWNAYS